MKTVLISGGTGYLGERLLPIAAQSAQVIASARDPSALGQLFDPRKLDITDAQATTALVASVKPDAIIHAAAINPGVDDASMASVNVEGTRNLARAASDAGCRLVIVSTDVLHNGAGAPYGDDAMPTPINPYGQTKADAEAVALNTHANTIAVRTSLIYGLDSMDRGTAGFVHRLNQGEPLTLFNDVLRQPVWRDALSAALVRLAIDLVDETGTINVTGSDVLDRATFGELMLDYWDIPYADGDVRRISAAERPDLTGLPIDCRVSLSRAKQLGLPIPGVYEVLKQHHQG